MTRPAASAARATLAAMLLFGAGGCGGPPECTSHEVQLATAEGATLRCADVDLLIDWTTVLAGRPVQEGLRRSLRSGLLEVFGDAPRDFDRLRARLTADLAQLEGGEGLDAGLRRSALAYRALNGPDALPDGAARRALRAAIAPWGEHPAEGLLLSEIDIEGWVFYASLAHEVQGRGPLRLSVGDRLAVYRQVQDRFRSGSAADRRALVGFGAFWWSARERWAAASFEQQQTWGASAPLPNPPPDLPLAYLDAMLAGPVDAHAGTFHELIGPLRLRTRH